MAGALIASLRQGRALLGQVRHFSSGHKRIDLDAPIALAAARTWDEGVSSNFATTPISDIFKNRKVVIFGVPGAFTGVCSQQHVPNYLKAADKLKEKGVHEIICVSVNDPYAMNAWAEKLGAKGKISFFGDYSGEFNESLGLGFDLTKALLSHRSNRWSALVENGEVMVLNVEENPGEFKVSDADTLLRSL